MGLRILLILFTNLAFFDFRVNRENNFAGELVLPEPTATTATRLIAPTKAWHGPAKGQQSAIGTNMGLWKLPFRGRQPARGTNMGLQEINV